MDIEQPFCRDDAEVSGTVLQGASGNPESVKNASTFCGALCSLNQVVPGSESVSSSSLSVSSLVSGLEVGGCSAGWVSFVAGGFFEERWERVLL